MFYQAATLALAAARKIPPKIDRAETRWRRHLQRMQELTQQGDDDEEEHWFYRKGVYEAYESLAIQAENVEFKVTEAYGPLLRQLALVHILSATSVEAHINIRAEAALKGKYWRTFEHLAVEAKWLFFPKILGLEGFEVGSEPYQSFSAIIVARNKLVHYKPQAEPYEGFDDPEAFAKRLDLTIDAAERSLRGVMGMVTRLASQLGERPPWWIASDNSHFFSIRRKP